MAIPKSLKALDSEKAKKLIAKHLKAKTGQWEYNEPFVGDFVYRTPSGRWYLIRKISCTDTWETGMVSM